MSDPHAPLPSFNAPLPPEVPGGELYVPATPIQVGSAGPAEPWADPLASLSPEDLLVQAAALPGSGRDIASLRAALNERQELAIKLRGYETMKGLEVHIPGGQLKAEINGNKIQQIVASILDRSAKSHESDRAKATTPGAAPADQEILADAMGLIDMIANSVAMDASPEMLLGYAAYDFVRNYFQSRGQWYKRGDHGSIEQVVEEQLAEDVQAQLASRRIARVVGTALEVLRKGGDETPVSVAPVLRNWQSHMRTYRILYTSLPSDESMVIRDDLLPVVITDRGDAIQMVLSRKTGKLDTEVPAGCNVLYPAVNVSADGESRALDAMVRHHFKTDEEVEAFYTTCGISLFGYGIPNLVFLLGQGGSGKDMLFAMMRAVHSDRLVCTLNSQALTGSDESNDFVRLQNARFALCSFESSHQSDGSFKPAVLKSITSGGINPITARAKYAKSAIDIYYRGSLWLYGNRVPNLTGGGDFDGLDRRFMILPMVKPLSKRAAPPQGFATWPDAVVACAPVFGYRCMDAFMRWHKDGSIGYNDVRRRIPEAWIRLSEEALLTSSKFGFLRDVFISDSHGHGLKESTVLDVMGVLMRENQKNRVPRARFMDTLKETLSTNVRFDDPGAGQLESREMAGFDMLPVTVNPVTLRQNLSLENYNEARQILISDGHWDPEAVTMGIEMNKLHNYRAILRGEAYDDDDETE